MTCLQGAIQMSQWELDHGSNPQLRNLSSTIIAEQTREVQQMQGCLMRLPACAPSPAPAQVAICAVTSIPECPHSAGLNFVYHAWACILHGSKAWA